MSDNTMLAIVLSTAIASCTACSVTDKVISSKSENPQTACVKAAWTQNARLECLKAEKKQ